MRHTHKLLLALGVIAGLTACTPQEVAWWVAHPEVEVPADLVIIPPCTGDEVVAFATDDPGQTTLDCDVTPPQTLTVIFDAFAWGDEDTWGGDASVQWAQQQCEQEGGTPVWVNEPGVEYHLRCTNWPF